MSVDQILDGAVAERDPRARHPLSEAEARGFLRRMEKQTPRSMRGAVARRLAETPVGNLSDAARALYRAYAAAYGA